MTNNNIFIGFDFIWDETPLLIKVAKKLRKEGINILGITLCNRWNFLLKDTDFTLINLGDYLKANWESVLIDDKAIEDIEQKYGNQHDLNFFISVDRLINEVNKNKFSTREDKIKFLILHLKFWEWLFKKHQFYGIYTTGTAFLGLLSGIIVAQEEKVNFKGIYTTRDNKPQINFVDNYNDNWSNLDKEYRLLLKRSLNESEKKFAKDYLEEFKEKHEKPVYMEHSWHISGFRLIFFKEFLKRVKRHLINQWGNNRFDYVTPPLFFRTLKELKVIIKRRILSNFYFRKFKNKQEKYILFPLHLQPEMSADIWGRNFSDQITTIKHISEVLPLKYKLYVKEHKVALGKRPGLFSYYKKLHNLSNVVLVNPNQDSHELIKKSELVVVISGTMGWEALLYGKPVITLGNVFYNSSGLTYKVSCFDSLGKVIKTALKSKVDKEKLYRYIVAKHKTAYKGYFNVPHCDKRTMSSSNIELLSKAIKKDIGSI
jgi:hypothetical protein